jgi:hypothetical protein
MAAAPERAAVRGTARIVHPAAPVQGPTPAICLPSQVRGVDTSATNWNQIDLRVQSVCLLPCARDGLKNRSKNQPVVHANKLKNLRDYSARKLEDKSEVRVWTTVAVLPVG